MAFVPIFKQIVRNDSEDGQPVYLVKGTHNTGDTLPTDHVEQGSWSLNLDSKEVVFFDATAKEWK